MSAVYLCPTFGVGYQGFTTGGLPLNAGLIYTYIAGGTTPQATYTTSGGTVQNANPIVLDADGRTPTEVWLLAGQAYRIDLKDSLGNLIKSYDNITGVNDPSAFGEWIPGPTPTFASATSFTLVGDQTGTFTVNRRVKTTNTGGTVYSSITASSFSVSTTTVTVVNDSGTLDSGLNAVSYGILQATNKSVPTFNEVVDLTTVAGTNTITASSSKAAAGLSAGQLFRFTPAATNTAATTLNVNSLGAKSIFCGGAACVGGELVINVPVIVEYDGTQFNLIGNETSTNGATASTFTFNGSGGTSGSITMTWRKQGQFVTLNIPAVSATTGTTSTTFTSNTALPASVRPASTQRGPLMCMLDNAAAVAPAGMFSITTGGVVIILRDGSGAAYTNSATAGTQNNQTITYFVG